MAYSQANLERASVMWKRGDSSDLIRQFMKMSHGQLAGLMSRNRDLFPKRRPSPVKVAPVNAVVPRRIERTIRKFDHQQDMDKLFAMNATEAVQRRLDSSAACIPVSFLEIGAYRCRWIMSGEAGPQMMCCNQPSASTTGGVAASYCR